MATLISKCCVCGKEYGKKVSQHDGYTYGYCSQACVDGVSVQMYQYDEHGRLGLVVGQVVDGKYFYRELLEKFIIIQDKRWNLFKLDNDRYESVSEGFVDMPFLAAAKNLAKEFNAIIIA